MAQGERDHPNAAALRKGYEAFVAGNLDMVAETIAEDAVWHLGGDSPVSGHYQGREQIMELFAGLAEFDYRITEVWDVVANDRHCVVIVHSQLSENGDTAEWNACHVYRMQNGLIVEGWFFFDNQAVLDGFLTQRARPRA